MFSNKLKVTLITLIFIIGFPILTSLPINEARAATAGFVITKISDTTSRQLQGAPSNHTISFTQGASYNTLSTTTLTLTFPSVGGFNASAITNGDITATNQTTNTNLALTSVSSSTNTININLSPFSIAQNDQIVIKIGTNAGGSHQVLNGSAGMQVVSLSGTALSSANMTKTFGILLNSNDQLSINAAVDPILAFSISNTTAGFGSFQGNNIRYATLDQNGSANNPEPGNPATLTATTNASGGVLISIYDSGNGTGGLYSLSVSDLISAAPSSQILSGSKLYGIFGKNPNSLIIDAGFDNDGVNDKAISNNSQSFATSTSVVLSGSVDIGLLAAINASTKAGNYSDIITITCTGRY